MPRSLAFCQSETVHNLIHLGRAYNVQDESLKMALESLNSLQEFTIDNVMEQGLHEFINTFLTENRALALQIEADYGFYA